MPCSAVHSHSERIPSLDRWPPVNPPPWTSTTVLAFVSAFLGTIAMWWLFFSARHEAASEVIAGAENAGAIARAAYTYAPIPVVAGIVVTAVGDEMVLAHPSGHVEAATTWVLLGGPALFLAGTAVAVFAVWGDWPRSRIYCW